jgi:hypothetical protein
MDIQFFCLTYKYSLVAALQASEKKNFHSQLNNEKVFICQNSLHFSV